MTAQGRFITFEGIDGAGKSTQIKRVASLLEARGESVLLTREPGGSTGAEDIRHLLVSGDPGRWSAETEILLFSAARRDHMEKRIAPALDAGQIVLCDRFVDSTRVYQGARAAGLRGLVDRIHADVIGREADLTILLDMDPKVALARGLSRQSGEDRFEDMGLSFQEKLRAGFLALAAAAPERFITVAADGTEDQIADAIRIALEARL